MNLFKNKLIVALPVIVLVIVFIFSLASIPSISPAAKNLPVAIVNEDAGLSSGENMGETMVTAIQSAIANNSTKDQPIKWVDVGTEEEASAGLDNQEYYAAVIIPKEYSANQASLVTSDPTSPQIKIYVNQGMNVTAANMAQQLLTQALNNLNANMRTQLIADFDQQGGTLTTKQAAALASPIASAVIPVNATGTSSANGNAPVTLFQPLWMASLIGSVIFLVVKNKMKFANRKEKLRTNGVQVLWGAFMAIVAGFGFTWFVDGWGLNIPDFMDIALFLAIAYFAFFLMISAVFSWIGFNGMPIFVLFLFFGAPLLSFAPEMLSPFYRDWIMSWLPMRFMVDGLRELFYFGDGLSLNHPTTALMWIGLGGLLVLLASGFKPASKPAINQGTEGISVDQ